eukprot:551362_1
MKSIFILALLAILCSYVNGGCTLGGCPAGEYCKKCKKCKPCSGISSSASGCATPPECSGSTSYLEEGPILYCSDGTTGGTTKCTGSNEGCKCNENCGCSNDDCNC